MNDFKVIPFDIFPTRCNITQFIYFWKTGKCRYSGRYQLLFDKYQIM